MQLETKAIILTFQVDIIKMLIIDISIRAKQQSNFKHVECVTIVFVD